MKTFCRGSYQALLWALCCALLQAQETGSITGQVLDPAGAVVVGARISANNDATGASFSGVADSIGFYRFPQLSPGSYTITATMSGFRTLVRQGVEVRVDDRLRLDLALEVGQVSDTVTVHGLALLLQTENAT